ncbi:MAG: hypothetical protein ACM31H_05340 [Nitrososphaerales archaeon]
MSKYMCECGIALSNNANKGSIAAHEKSNAHKLRIKYKDILEDDKIFCEGCNLKIDILKYENHLESFNHIELDKVLHPGFTKTPPIIKENGLVFFKSYINYL